MITSQKIQMRRSPRELRRFAEDVREAVKKDRAEFELGMQKCGLYKEFLDEIEPLSYFAILQYPNTHSVEPVLGNQGYDAVIYDADGQIVDRVELTKPYDGATAATDAREVIKHGFGGIRVHDPGDETEVLLPIIERTCRSKAQKDYSDATLVFVIPALPPLSGFEDRFEAQLSRIKASLASPTYRAKRVFMLVPPGTLERVG